MLPRVRWLGLFFVSSFLGCEGPPAPDSALCRDVIERVCIAQCAAATLQLNLPAMECETELLRRTGCDSPLFEFTTPDRSRVLECRLPLVRNSVDRFAPPPCDYVDETIRICPDVARFLGGNP